MSVEREPGSSYEPMQVLNVVGGRDVGEPEHERQNPAHPGQVVTISAVASTDLTDEAVEAACAAQGSWALTPPPIRGKHLFRAAELLNERAEIVAEHITREEGKTLAEAKQEVTRTVDILRYFAAEGWREVGEVFAGSAIRSHVQTRHHPVGVVAIITPWNFPLAIPAWKIAPALIYGNTVVLKPSIVTAGTARHLVDCLNESGLPPGVVNLIVGTGSDAGERLVSNHQVDAVSFTGSTAVGKAITRIVHNRAGRVQAEMGGKNALVVLDDADLDAAAQVAAKGAFGLTGQSCTATSRLVVSRSIAEPLLEKVAQAAAGYRAGDGLLHGTGMGPVATYSQMKEHEEAIALGQSEGASIYLEGRVTGPQLREPVILVDVQPYDEVAQREIFGPILGVLEVNDLDEAISVVNSSQYGLTAAICTGDLFQAQIFADQVEAGVVKINTPTTGLELHAPFGGVKDSSTSDSREQGQYARQFYTWVKTVYTQY